MAPADLAVRQAGLDQLGVVRVVAVLGMGQHGVDIHDGGVFQRGGEEVLLLAVGGGAEPLDLHSRQHFSSSQCLVKQGGGLVQRAGKGQRLMYPLSGGLAALRIGGGRDLMVDCLGENFVFVAFHKDITH